MSTRYGAVHATERHESALVRHTFLTVAILLSWGCGSTTSPQPRSDAVVVTGLENGRAALLDGQSLKLLRFVGPALYSSGYASISPDSSLLLLSGQNAAGDNAYVVALNTATFELEWSIRFDRLTGAGVTRLFLPQIVGLSPDRRRLYVFPVDSADLAGIAAIDVAAHKIIAFRALRVFATRILVFRGNAATPKGTIAVTATRSAASSAKPNAVFLLTPHLAIVDSIPVPTGAMGAYDAVLSADETQMSVLAPPFLSLLDVGARSVTTTVAASLPAGLLSNGIASAFYHVDGGEAMLPDAPDHFAEYAGNLTSVRHLSLIGAASTGGVGRARAVAVSATGTTAFVATGSLPTSPNAQKAAIAQYDLGTGRRIRTSSLGQFGLSLRVFAFP